MDDHLVEYLLNTLDPATQARLEAHLRQSPEARAKLELLRRALAPLADDEIAPPPGLALMALARVAEYRCALPAAPPLAPGERAGGGRRWFGRAEWVVAAAVLLLVTGLGLPWMLGLWRDSHRLACANNLRRFHADLQAFADANDGDFPRVEPGGALAFAGVFVPLLADHGLMKEANVNCPAQDRPPAPRVTVAELIALSNDDPPRYQAVASRLAGDYAYCLGYEQPDRLQLYGLRRTSGDLLPILADNAGPGGENSDNHGGGQNVLYVGGQVRWCVRPTVGVENDHIYLNRHNRVQAGVNHVDTVLGGSGARPFLP